MKTLFLGLQAFREDVIGHHVTAMCDNSTVVAYVNKQGGTVSRALCLLASRFLRWTESFDIHLDARYLPGQANVLADVLSRRGQVVGTEWSLHPQVARSLLRVWGNPSIDLFATFLNAKLPLHCSLVPAGASFGGVLGGGGGANALPKPQLAPHILQAPRSNSSCFSIIPTEIQMYHHFNITFSYTLHVFFLFLFFCD